MKTTELKLEQEQNITSAIFVKLTYTRTTNTTHESSKSYREKLAIKQRLQKNHLSVRPLQKTNKVTHRFFFQKRAQNNYNTIISWFPYFLCWSSNFPKKSSFKGIDNNQLVKWKFKKFYFNYTTSFWLQWAFFAVFDAKIYVASSDKLHRWLVCYWWRSQKIEKKANICIQRPRWNE